MMQNMFGNYYKTNEYYAGSISFVDENGRTEDYRFTQEELDNVMEAVQRCGSGKHDGLSTLFAPCR